jgi:DNA repair protein SbcC/Rad50
MAVKSVSIRNFQSLAKVDLDLGRFTVIVGPSSSGKSAFIRACKAIASNMRGAGNITRGAKAAAITVRTGTHVVTLERTETGGKYRVVGPTDAEASYTKLNQGVPDDVTRALGIAPVPANSMSANFAGQFDPPFLLRESGATVARTLGELTNVDRIFEAVREANRRRNTFTAALHTREADLAVVRERMAEFVGLPARLRRLDEAEQTAETCQSLAGRAHRLRQATETLEVAEAVLARTRELPPVPSTTAVDAAEARLAAFKGLLKDWLAHTKLAADWQAEAGQLAGTEHGLHEELHATLTAAGHCPTCGRTIG